MNFNFDIFNGEIEAETDDSEAKRGVLGLGALLIGAIAPNNDVTRIALSVIGPTAVWCLMNSEDGECSESRSEDGSREGTTINLDHHSEGDSEERRNGDRAPKGNVNSDGDLDLESNVEQL
jgi:hypothetical protein